MDLRKLSQYADRLSKVVGLLTGVGALVTYLADHPAASCVLAAVAWLLLARELWRKGTRELRPSEKAGERDPRGLARLSLLLLTLLVAAWVGWHVWSFVRSNVDMATAGCPGDRLCIAVAEFTRGAAERATYAGGRDVRAKLYDDLLRLLAQHELAHRVAICQAGPVKSREQAYNLGRNVGADLVVWGYVPSNQPNSFRPSFAILTATEELERVNPVLFGVEITGSDVAEASTLLTQRVRTVTGLVLGLLLLEPGQQSVSEPHVCISLLDQAIEAAASEYTQNSSMREDLSYNLALLSTVRGRTYAALGDDERALIDYRQALTYSPDQLTSVHTAMGNVYYVRGDSENAEKHYEMDARSWRGQYGLALVSYQRGQYGVAVQHLETAMQMVHDEGLAPGCTTDLKIRFVLGMAFKQLGNWAAAEPLLNQVCLAEALPVDFRAGVCRELTPVPSPATLPPATMPTPVLPTSTIIFLTPLPPLPPMPTCTPTFSLLPTAVLPTIPGPPPRIATATWTPLPTMLPSPTAGPPPAYP